MYDRFILIGNFCSLGIVLWIVGQLGYNGTKIIDSLKQHAFNTGIGTILRAFCCGVAVFITNPKYSQVPRAKDDVEEGLQRQEATAGDKGADWARLKQGSELMHGPASQGQTAQDWSSE